MPARAHNAIIRNDPVSFICYLFTATSNTDLLSVGSARTALGGLSDRLTPVLARIRSEHDLEHSLYASRDIHLRRYYPERRTGRSDVRSGEIHLVEDVQEVSAKLQPYLLVDWYMLQQRRIRRVVG